MGRIEETKALSKNSSSSDLRLIARTVSLETVPCLVFYGVASALYYLFILGQVRGMIVNLILDVDTTVTATVYILHHLMLHV